MTAASGNKGLNLGVNGLGRIGKLTVWHHIGRKYFNEIVVNIGRNAGTSLADIAHYIERDSSYGLLRSFLHGHAADMVIGDIDESESTILADGMRISIMRSDRNPADIAWGKHGVRLVVDTTGRFLDPTLPPDHPGGSIPLGHQLVDYPQSKLKKMWVILHTSLSGVFNNAMVEKVGADDFIPKFHPDELATAVKKWLKHDEVS